VPQRQSHRGQHREDAALFAPKRVPTLREAVVDLSWLLTREYAEAAALKLVGDHYQLDKRQRLAVTRAACSDQSLEYRRAHEVPVEDLGGRNLVIDGYNLLITVECALSGAILIRGRDGCIRDIASVHGSYQCVEETSPAIHLIGQTLASLDIKSAHWYFDTPVSNSGRLRKLIEAQAAAADWNWTVTLEKNPDNILAESKDVVVTSDSWILDRAAAWTNLAASRGWQHHLDCGVVSPQPK